MFRRLLVFFLIVATFRLAANQSPAIGLDQDGNAIALWLHKMPGESADQTEILYVTKFFNQPWSSPENISPLPTFYPEGSVLSINSLGDAVAAWKASCSSGSCFEIQAVTGSLKSAWNPVQNIADADASKITFPRVSMSSSGEAAIIWRTDKNSILNDTIYLSTYDAANKTWGSPMPLKTHCSIAAQYAVAMNASNDIMAILADVGELSAVLLPSGKTVVLSKTGQNPQVALNDQGEAACFWSTSGEDTAVVQGSLYSDGKWGSVTSFSSNKLYANFPQIDMNNDGKVVATWFTAVNQNSGVVQASIYSQGDWSPAINLTNLKFSASAPQLSMNSLGQAAVIWQVTTTSTSNPINSSENFIHR